MRRDRLFEEGLPPGERRRLLRRLPRRLQDRGPLRARRGDVEGELGVRHGLLRGTEGEGALRRLRQPVTGARRERIGLGPAEDCDTPGREAGDIRGIVARRPRRR
jgi:hypothetical protein